MGCGVAGDGIPAVVNHLVRSAEANVVGGDFVESYGGRVVLADLVASYSTTATIAALKAGRKE